QSARQQKEALFVYEPGSFVPLATVQDGQTYWYQCDQIGAPLELTDAEGNIAWAADYKVWGEARVRETESKATGTYGNDKARRPTGHGPGWSQSRKTEADVLALQWQQQPVEQPFRLQGQQFDEETGLHYNRHRYYDPAVGRFVNQDPIGLAGGTNLFTYGPNANNWIDPAGLAGYIVLGEGQNGVDAYAKQLGLDRPGDSFKTISGEWQKITDKIPGELKPRTQEWTCAAAKANGDWIKEKAKEGYKFIIIGTDGQSVRSPFYKEELKALRESGIKPYDHSMKPGVSNARSSCFCPGKAKPKDRPNHQCD
ncbi:RHS repeat domain-containing protein, partial [Sphingomonas sp. NCPPB 2930]